MENEYSDIEDSKEICNSSQDTTDLSEDEELELSASSSDALAA
jgi:hypothetical protein